MIPLAEFDPKILTEHDVTEAELNQIVRYLRLLQGPNALALEKITVGGYYGTAALLHELVEFDILLEREPRLLEMDRNTILDFWHSNEDAHATALASEYKYLRDVIQRLLSMTVDLGALIVANASEQDFDILAESNIEAPLFKPDDEQVKEAKKCLIACGHCRMVIL